jgi:ceramide glucosyltransferase
VASDFLANAVAPLRAAEVGLVNCFYRLANPTTLAMQWEAIAINADFWSQVLQSQTLKPLDFALGAVMLTRRKQLDEIGGFKSLVDCLADDYQLGNRIARKGYQVVLCPVVVECWDPPMTWGAVWKHQLRWARTIRVCQPAPYFFSILSNAGFWSLLALVAGLFQTRVHSSSLISDGNSFAMASSVRFSLLAIIGGTGLLLRVIAAQNLQGRLTRSSAHFGYFWLVPIKDLLQAVIWLCAFAGNRIEWRGQVYKLRRDGTLVKTNP